ncbi:DgyrCDS7489 [Dimorphilus gyrociliatus]|uniref:Nicotinate phosphoribosyltransferase n=1 Tax=Dimorphilus gyrociliatus TaxID=2664684 RepID=A0A7I8VR68_9ANNE|nr:DgyrCDS7489 [Dimorphilus gyrociliatus]
MAYAYWKSGKMSETAVFDLFFRKNPFGGEFTIYAGLSEVLKFLSNFRYSECDIEYLRSVLPPTEPAFFDYLKTVSTKDIKLYAVEEGSVIFPKVPVMRVEGPLPIVQLLETTLLNLTNYASLVATNAARFRLAAGNQKALLEFGLRRAQGPDGGLSASRYCYLGGFDGTSNVLAGKLFDIPVKGTHAHAFVTSFTNLEEVKHATLASKTGAQSVNLAEKTVEWLEKISSILNIIPGETNKGELAAFIAYAASFPSSFLCLVDTYDVQRSGMPNFLAVSLVLHSLGYRPMGVRLDSGDLAYLSNSVRRAFMTISMELEIDYLADLTIIASNDINEDTIHSLNQQGHAIDGFGIGTHLVTCQKQPALGCVFKLVEVGGLPRIKLSEDVEKVTMPGAKNVYRLYSQDGHALVDLLQRLDEPAPKAGEKVLVRHPFHESKRAYVSPTRIEPLYKLYWANEKLQENLPHLIDIRNHAKQELAKIREDHKRALNPTPYKVSVSDRLYNFIHDLWLANAPIGELS